jgi:serine/threonine protein phosphatase 1
MSETTFERLIAIGDIHGQQNMLADLLSQIQPTNNDQLVFLGDYIDRGPDSKGVIETLMGLQKQFPQTIFLRGNHEQMFLDAMVDLGIRQGDRLEDLDRDWCWEIRNHQNVGIFEGNGGNKTIEGYGAKIERDPETYFKFNLCGEIPPDHIEFLEQTKLSFRCKNYLFAHAEYADQDDPYTLLWGPDGRWGWKPYKKEEHDISVVGHNVVDTVEEKFGYIHVDTGAGWEKHLSAIDVLSGQVWRSFSLKEEKL